MKSSARLVRATGKEKTPKKVHANSPYRSRLYDDQSAFLGLQRAIGNRAIGQLIQAKLKVSQPDDKYEREADRIADEVMRMSAPPLQQQQHTEEDEEEDLIQTKSLAAQITPLIQRQIEEEMVQNKLQDSALLQRQIEPEEEDEEEETIQPKEFSSQIQEATPALAYRINAMKGGGKLLSDSERAFFEPRLGYDFSGVRVHTGGEADNLNRQLNAKAFTVGKDIVFGEGQYTPGAKEGQRLLAHELTHVVQQTSSVNRKSIQWRPQPAYTATPKQIVQLYSESISVRNMGSGIDPSTVELGPLYGTIDVVPSSAGASSSYLPFDGTRIETVTLDETVVDFQIV